MSSFLDRTAQALLHHHGRDLGRVAVVLPGQRAGLHLRRYLARHAGAALWSPDMLDMGGFMGRLTGLEQGRSMDMLLMLHQVHRAVAQASAEPLSTFLQWAPVVLRDMSEVDSHLLDLDDLYRDLRAFEGIDAWSLALGEDLSPGQHRLLDHWRNTGTMHRQLHQAMEERGLGTSGWIARKAAEALPTTTALPWDMVWCVGLNALEPASTSVMRSLQKRGVLQVAWDTDHYYLDNPSHEAGRFIRRSIADLGAGVIPPGDGTLKNERRIHAVQVPDRISQARYAAQQLEAMSDEERDRTTVVLADEDLLMPLLEAMPSSLAPVNITMGVPLSALPVHGLVDAFLDLLIIRGDGGPLPLDALLKLINHPFLDQGPRTRALVHRLSRIDQPGISLAILEANAAELGMDHLAVMREALSARVLQEALTLLFQWALATSGDQALAAEQIFRMSSLQDHLDQALQAYHGASDDLAEHCRIRERLLGDEQIGFYGDPIKGLQVMGFLETRAIDMDRMLVLGANEGTLPQGSVQQSYIPFDVRRAYGLPLRADSEAITAYHVHRLLHQAQDITLVSDVGGSVEADEPTRYIAQWEYELVPISRTRCEHGTVALQRSPRGAATIRVVRSPAIAERLEQLATRGLSPSGLGTWLRCPLDYYFSYILGIDAPEERTGKLGSDVLGEAVHGVLQDLATPFLGKVLDPESMRAWTGQVRPMLAQRLALNAPLETLETGHHRLRLDMASKAVIEHIRTEAERYEKGAQVIPLALETELSAVLPNGIRLKGRCDRIDRRDGVIHIMDLKTGSVKERSLSLKQVSREALGSDQRHALQLLIYAWMYMANDPECERLCAGIVPLQRASQASGLYLELGGSEIIGRGHFDELTELLTTLTNEVMVSSLPFEHDPESEYCACCLA